MTIDATHLGLVGLETGDPNWQAAVYVALALTESELAEIVDEATPCARLGAGIGADAPTTLRLVAEVRELRAQVAAARAYMDAHDEYDRTDRHPNDRAAARDARQAAFLALREALL